MRVCARCKNTVTNLRPFKPVAPFWKHLPDIFLFPIRDGDWIRFASWAGVVIVLRGFGEFAVRYEGIIGLVYGIPLLVAYYSMLVTYFFRVIGKAEDGNFDVPYWPSFHGLDFSMVWPIAQFLVVVLMALWPFAVVVGAFAAVHDLNSEAIHTSLGSAIGSTLIGLALAIGAVQLPMGMLVLGVHRSALHAANPVTVVRQIRKIPRAYFLACLVLFGFVAVYAAVALLLALLVGLTPGMMSIVVALALYPIDGLVQLYAFMVAGHLLGYLAYQERFALKWWPLFEQDTLVRVGGRQILLDPSQFGTPMSPADLRTGSEIAPPA